MKKKNWIMNMVSDGSDVSMKRVITVAAFVLFALAFLLDLFLDVKVDPKFLEVDEALIMTGLVTVLGEKFAKKNPATSQESTTTTTTQKTSTEDPKI